MILKNIHVLFSLTAECRLCPHASNSVNFSLVKKTLKQGCPIGQCTQCRKGHTANLNHKEENPIIVSILILNFCFIHYLFKAKLYWFQPIEPEVNSL